MKTTLALILLGVIGLVGGLFSIKESQKEVEARQALRNSDIEFEGRILSIVVNDLALRDFVKIYAQRTPHNAYETNSQILLNQVWISLASGKEQEAIAALKSVNK